MTTEGAGTRELGTGATLTIWQREDGFYWLIDAEDGQRRADVGPFETARHAEEDARAWWASEHASEDPFLSPNTIDEIGDIEVENEDE